MRVVDGGFVSQVSSLTRVLLRPPPQREARERQKNTTRNLQERDAKRIERWRQRAAWKAEALAAESA